MQYNVLTHVVNRYIPVEESLGLWYITRKEALHEARSFPVEAPSLESGKWLKDNAFHREEGGSCKKMAKNLATAEGIPKHQRGYRRDR